MNNSSHDSHTSETSHEATARILRTAHALSHPGSPLLVAAPMVRQSELAFRTLARCHNFPLAFTPMIPAVAYSMFTEEERQNNFDLGDDESLLVAQLCGHDPSTMIVAAKALLATGRVDAIDINLGCPQQCAKRGGYGAFLLERDQWPTVDRLIRSMVDAGISPLWCKIRLLENHKMTMEFLLMLRKAGISLVTIHGRKREQRSRERADWASIRRVVDDLKCLERLERLERLDDARVGDRRRLFVLSNGSVSSVEAAIECERMTECDGIMVAEGLLENPWKFDVGGGGADETDGLASVRHAREYLECARNFPPPKFSRGRCLRDHVGWMLKKNLLLLVEEEAREEREKKSGRGGRSRALLGMLENDKMVTMWQMEHFLNHVEEYYLHGSVERMRSGLIVLSLKDILKGEKD